MFFLKKKTVECQSLSQGRTQNVWLEWANSAPGQRRHNRNAEPPTEPSWLYPEQVEQREKPTQEYNTITIYSLAITSCIVKDNKVMNDQCKIQ